jgi:hypothetical protein
MIIELNKIKVKELADGYKDKNEEGVVGYGGKLDIRPPYQREFIYSGEQRGSVIDSIFKEYPLNVMYWAVNEDGGFEIIDGQQRTISICQYIHGDFSHNGLMFLNHREDIREKILNYELMVYFCEGTPTEKLEWFRIINIAGAKLTDQEMLNAVFHGPFVSKARKYFSKSGCPAYSIGNRYVIGNVNRQDFLEEALNWISGGNIQDYMSRAQNKEEHADLLFIYFEKVIKWIEKTFPKYRNEMKGVDWGFLFSQHLHWSNGKPPNPIKLEKEIADLMENEDIKRKKGIYYYVLNRDPRELNLRTFTSAQKRTQYEKQGGICAITGVPYEIEDMEGDHIIPWSRGGKTTIDNLQMVSKEANRAKSNN